VSGLCVIIVVTASREGCQERSLPSWAFGCGLLDFVDQDSDPSIGLPHGIHPAMGPLLRRERRVEERLREANLDAGCRGSENG
jgi:hypothetical protein